MSPLDSQLRANVAALALPARRMVGSPGHAEARRFLCTHIAKLQLESYDDALDYLLHYEQGGQEFSNLVGVLTGADRRARPILLGAHHDSVIDAPCADDKAAAAITLAIVELLREARPGRNMIVAFFNAEELPLTATVTAGQAQESKRVTVTLEAVRLLNGKGRPTYRPRKLAGEKSHSYPRVHAYLMPTRHHPGHPHPQRPARQPAFDK